MLIVVSSRHYTEWEQDGEDGYDALSEDTRDLSVGIYTSVKTCAQFIAKFVNDFEPSEDDMEGPVSSFRLSLADLDKPVEEGQFLMELGVTTDEDEIYSKIVVKLEELEARRATIGGDVKAHYEKSSNGRYILSRDGAEVMRGPEEALWKYIHSNHGYSVGHALNHEGYSIQPEMAG